MVSGNSSRDRVVLEARLPDCQWTAVPSKAVLAWLCWLQSSCLPMGPHRLALDCVHCDGHRAETPSEDVSHVEHPCGSRF